MGSYVEQRRESSSVSMWIKFAFLGVVISFCFQGALCEEPTESQCRPYIEKALKEQHLEVGEHIPEGPDDTELLNDQDKFPPTDELTDSTEGSITNEDEGKSGDDDDNEDNEAEIKVENEDDADENDDGKTEDEDNTNEQEDDKTEEGDDDADDNDEKEDREGKETEADDTKVGEDTLEDQDDEKAEDEQEENAAEESENDDDDDKDSNLERPIDIETHDVEMDDDDDDDDDNKTEEIEEDEKDKDEAEGQKDEDEKETEDEQGEKEVEDEQEDEQEVEGKQEEEQQAAADQQLDDHDDDDDDKEKDEGVPKKPDIDDDDDTKDDDKEEESEKDERDDDDDDQKESATTEETEEEEGKDDKEGDDKEEEESREESSDDEVEEKIEKKDVKKLTSKAEETEDKEDQETSDQEAPEEEELIKEMVIPDNLRPRDHIDKILKLEDSGVETILEKTIDTTLKALKGLYDNAIKPLEMLYKYRDLSNRHFGDPEIFSKPLILFMGPWSGGKSSTINYLLDNEFSHTSLRTGAEPSPAYFNILMHGEQEEILDGTQLAADWTFSGLQKFGQGLLDRLKGIKLPNKLLEKVNIVEIPGILEIRKQVQRLFPFNDACQWFIDRADIIFLVYDPSKLDVGPETEAILDQLKGREYQTRIILNKADQVKPEELMRVQGTLIWNISPLMSSSEPPIMYSTSLWSLPYEVGAPTRLLQAQERAFLKDLREAIDKRVENKISSARRFAVRVRNHAKMVDCYLTTYYNHKSIFGNRKKISDDIIEYPQKYHIYEGLSTLTNISRYDLPDPDVYRDFFKINPLYEFKKLSETCTYFRGCPINKLDVAIAYDLPELVGKYKKAVESAKEQLQKENS